jgi:hypothetical protein
MVPLDRPLKAYVHSLDSNRDLALLKLAEQPDFELATIQLAKRSSTPGEACMTIGHPASGWLWTLRTGEVAGVGSWPQDMIQNMVARFSLVGDELQQFEQSLRRSPSRKALISTCGINPGDSGGPLLNSQGQLIAVNFAVPKIDVDNLVSLDKFSYHVHLDELKRFLEIRPPRPATHVPDVFPTADSSDLYDKDEDGRFESWVFRFNQYDNATGVLIDLDNDTDEDIADQFADQFADRSKFEFEFAFHDFPLSRTFYDRDNDGRVDAILTDVDNDDACDLFIYQMQAEGAEQPVWIKKRLVKSQPMRDYTLFKDRAIGKRLEYLFNYHAGDRDAGRAK